MAHLILDDIQVENPKVKAISKTIEKAVDSVKKGTPILLDSLVLLTITFWYFFWTGLAILFGKRIPKEWLKIATKLSKEKIAKKISGVETIKKPNTFKVVDLETRELIPLKP